MQLNYEHFFAKLLYLVISIYKQKWELIESNYIKKCKIYYWNHQKFQIFLLATSCIARDPCFFSFLFSYTINILDYVYLDLVIINGYQQFVLFCIFYLNILKYIRSGCISKFKSDKTNSDKINSTIK